MHYYYIHYDFDLSFDYIKQLSDFFGYVPFLFLVGDLWHLTQQKYNICHSTDEIWISKLFFLKLLERDFIFFWNTTYIVIYVMEVIR